jgi:hypothetical protein
MIIKKPNHMVIFKKEIFNAMCSLLMESGFSKRQNYKILKRKFYRNYTLARSAKSINLKLKFSRHRFKFLNNTTTLNGFYHAK